VRVAGLCVHVGLRMSRTSQAQGESYVPSWCMQLASIALGTEESGESSWSVCTCRAQDESYTSSSGVSHTYQADSHSWL